MRYLSSFQNFCKKYLTKVTAIIFGIMCSASKYIHPIPCKNKEVYSELNTLICEYLEISGLEQALNTFTKECQLKNLPCPVGSKEVKAAFTHYDGEALMKSFDEGDLDTFLKLWEQFRAHIEVTSPDMKKLEVYLRVHFAIYEKSKNDSDLKQSQAMQSLKAYFEENSTTLSSDATILPLFALPFVSDPKPHPIFKDLFQDSWSKKLRHQLETTINQYFELLQENISSHCKLAYIVKCRSQHSSASSSTATSNNAVCPKKVSSNSKSEKESTSVKVLHQSEDSAVPQGQGEMQSIVKSTIPYHLERFYQLIKIHRKTRKELNTVRENYSKLFRVSSHFLAALEKAVATSGRVRLDLVVQQCCTIYPDVFKSPSSTCFKMKAHLEHFKKLAASSSTSVLAPETSDISLLFLGISDIGLSTINYEKIKEDLTSDTISTTEKLCLLQALRWFITKTAPNFRSQVVEHFVSNDILSLEPTKKNVELKNNLFSCLLSSTPTYLKESMSRFINALASTWEGRKYLTSTEYIIEVLIRTLSTFKTKDEAFICHMVIAAMQKLSLRKNMRRAMIAQNVIPWLVKYIKSELERDMIRDELIKAENVSNNNNNNEGNYGETSFNNYLMEYAWALLMNLCLHPESIKSALTVDFEFLHCITTMLTCRTSFDFTPYVLSTLFSLLQNPEMFDKARTMNLDKRLGPLTQSNHPPEVITHLKHLLTQLYQRENVDRFIEAGETEYDDSDNSEPEEVEMELELAESWMNGQNETTLLTGDVLIIRKYIYFDYHKSF